LPSKTPGRSVADILGAIARIGAYVKDIGGVEALPKRLPKYAADRSG
jgi:hypothetical protein